MDNQPAPSPTKNSNASKILIFILVIVGIGISFTTGFYLSNLLQIEKNPSPTPNPTNSSPLPSVNNSPLPSSSGEFTETYNIAPGKKYFEDTIMMVAKDAPNVTLIATVTRLEQNSGYSQETRLTYFDGSNWTRKIASDNTPDPNVKSNNLVTSWNPKIDSSRVLKETLDGSVSFDGHNLSFSSGVLANEISMRSLPGYTKLMSNGQGTFTIDGKQYQAYSLGTKIYSLNSNDIQFYSQPLGLTTDWLAFWDNNGNFYHVDSTILAKPTPVYKPHQVVVYESASGSQTKTFQVNVTRSSETPPQKYTFNLPEPINQSLNLNLISAENKATSSSYKWFLGQVNGTVTTDGKNIPGIGIVEYIND